MNQDNSTLSAWRPASDPPAKPEWVIIFAPTTNSAAITGIFNGNGWTDDMGEAIVVTHWQPFPAPPTELREGMKEDKSLPIHTPEAVDFTKTHFTAPEWTDFAISLERRLVVDALRAENEKLKAGLESHAWEILADCEKHNADLLSDNNLLQANNQQLRASLAELREIATAMRSMIEDIQAPYMVSTSKPVAAFDEWKERNP